MNSTQKKNDASRDEMDVHPYTRASRLYGRSDMWEKEVVLF